MGFYKKVGESIICDIKEGQEVRYFIPSSWFSSNIAFATGEFINVLGVFPYALFDEKDKMIGKMKQFNFPTAFLCQPYKTEIIKDFKLNEYSDPIEYNVLRFKKGDKLIVETKVPQMTENLEEFFKLFVITGNIPNTISYEKIYQYFLDNIKYSGNKYGGVPNQMLGIFISKICRDIHDKTKPFRLSEEKKKKQFTAYKSTSVKEIPKYTSVYAAFTSENFDDSIIAATQIKKNAYSPLERVLMGSSSTPSTDAKE